MSNLIDDKMICLTIDDDIDYTTISFDILSKEITFDLNVCELERPELITYFVKDKRWGSFSEGFWHRLPTNLISYLMNLYKNDLPEGLKFVYG